MGSVDLAVFLSSLSLLVAMVAVHQVTRARTWSNVLTALVALVVLSATIVTGFNLQPGTNYLRLLWQLARERDMSAAVSAGMGAAVGAAWFIWVFDRRGTKSDSRDSTGAIPAVSKLIGSASLLAIFFACQLFIWKEVSGVRRDPAVRVHAPGFIVEKVAHLDFPPIRIAADANGKVYVTYDYFEDSGTIGGGIVELSEDSHGRMQKKIVADSPLLIRSHGLACRHGALFVSRSGFAARTVQGKVIYENLGAVTELRDLDGDGYFEFLNDIVSGLPGARGPITMHQNNGICFDSAGNLLVTTASAGDRSLDLHPWDGAILQISPDHGRIEVLARGFRNPFGIAIGPQGELFCTDNDVDENPGDELNHVIRDGHYGHPYVLPGDPSGKAEGFQQPVFVGELESNLLGLAYATASPIPESYRNCFYVADYMQHAIWRISVERSADTFRMSHVERFATISTAIDLAITTAGDLFVISRNTQNVYRIRPRVSANSGG